MESNYSYDVVIGVLVRSTVNAIQAARLARIAHFVDCADASAMLMESAFEHAETAEQADIELAETIGDAN